MSSPRCYSQSQETGKELAALAWQFRWRVEEYDKKELGTGTLINKQKEWQNPDGNESHALARQPPVNKSPMKTLQALRKWC